MSKRSKRDAQGKTPKFPRPEKLATLHIDTDNERFVFTTKDMIQNQLRRDGPKIRRSFDLVAKDDIAACSAVFGLAAGLCFRHLPRFDDNGYKATVSRLLSSAMSTYLASIEVARHGYRRQYGVLARSLIETIATVIAIAIRPTALEQFHAGTLQSTKCVGWAKEVLEPLGMYYGMLSDQFVHIGPAHAAFEPIRLYTPDDEALSFIASSMRGNVWMLFLTAELVFHDEIGNCRYWKPMGEGVAFDPSPEERQWMASFLITPDERASA